MNKKNGYFLFFITLLFGISAGYSEWIYNPFTDKLDYYLNVNYTLYLNETYANETFVLSDDWTSHDDYPAACVAGEYVSAIGDVLVCSAPASSPSYNSSYEYWNNATLSSYLNLSGTNANQNIMIYPYNITTSWINTTGFNISGYIDGNLLPLATLTQDIGSGTNRWRYGYFQNISSDYINNAYEITSTGNITGDYFMGSGAYLTDLNISGDITGYILNISYLAGHDGLGSMDLRGDPWWLGSVNLEVENNITADFFKGDGRFLTNIPTYNTSYVLNTGDKMTGDLTIESLSPDLFLNDTTDGTVGWRISDIDDTFTISHKSGDIWTEITQITSNAFYINKNTSIDSGTLFIDSTNDRVGIGTTAPNYTLDISGNVSITGTENPLLKITNGTNNFMTIDSSGNVGIGLEGTARGLLHLNGTGASSLFWQGGSSSVLRLNFGDAEDDNIGQISYGNNLDYMAFTTNTSEAMRIDALGRVGINTTSPSETFDINGNLKVRNTLIIGTGSAQKNITMTSPDASEWCCGVSNAGIFSCRTGAC